MLLCKKMFIFASHFVHIEQISKDVIVKTFVLYLFSILWTVIGLSNSELDICSEGVVEKTTTPTTHISLSQYSSNSASNTISFESVSNFISSYATQSNNFVKEDIKHKTQSKSAILGQRLCKLNSIHYSHTLSLSLVSPERALYVLAILCRLNI